MSFCSGARRYTVRYTHTEPDKLSFSGSGQVYCPINGGTLTGEWIENIDYRRYFDIGYFTVGAEGIACGDTWAYVTTYFTESSLGIDYAIEDDYWYKPFAENSEEKVYPSVINKDFVDLIFEKNNYLDPEITNQYGGFILSGESNRRLGSGRLIKFDECTPRDRPFHLGGGTYYPISSFPALDIGAPTTFRANRNSLWYASIKENGNEIFVFGEKPGFTRGTGYPDFLPPPNRQIQLTSSNSFTVELTFEKWQRESSIHIELEPYNPWRYSSSDRRVYIGGDRFRLYFVERDYNGNYINGIPSPHLLSGGVTMPEDFEFICIGCPTNTCAVDCGDKICCYGSDGIATNFYYK